MIPKLDVQVSRRGVMLNGLACAVGAAGAVVAAGAAQRGIASNRLGTLKERAAAKGMFFGTAISRVTLADPHVRQEVIDECDLVVPENALKWQATEPRPGHFSFAEADELYAFAASHGIRMRGHNLIWYSGLPRWVSARVPGMSVAATEKLVETYIRTVVERWRGKLVHWDVVNEAVNAPNQLTRFPIGEKLGEHYIDLAFHTARQADPDTLLVLNQSAIESDEHGYLGRRVGTLRLLERLLKRGVPVQALGIESHLRTKLPFTQAPWARFLEEVRGMGLKIIVTEFDITDSGFIGMIPERDRKSAAWTKAYLDVTLGNPACLGMLTWGMVNKYSWLRARKEDARADGAPLRPAVYDDNYRRTPLWDAVASALEHAPAR